MIDIKLLPLSDQIFQYINPDTNEYIVFAATRLLVTLIKDARHDLVRISALTQDQIKQIEPSIEEHRIETFDPHFAELPIVGCTWDVDKRTTIVDGNHRLTYNWRRGRREFKWFDVPEQMWREFLVLGVPRQSAEQILAAESPRGMWRGKAKIFQGT